MTTPVNRLPERPRRTWPALALLAAGLALLYATYIGMPVRSTLDPASIAPTRANLGQHAFTARFSLLPVRIGSSAPQAGFRLFEDGRPLGPAYSSPREIAVLGEGRYAFRDRRIIFSSSDNSDPRSNGRAYSYAGQVRLPGVFLLIALLCFAGAAWLGRHQPVLIGAARRFGLADRESVRATVKSTWRRILGVGWPLLPVGVVASLFVSPNIHIDSAVQASLYLNDFVIPHYPPLYPLFIRSIAVVTESVLWVFGGPAPHGMTEPNITAPALMIALLAQHGMTIAGSAYAASQFRLSLTAQRLLAALFYLNPFTLLSIHGIHTEALTAIFVLAAFGAAIPILLYGQWSLGRVAWFFVWVVLATLSRYAAIAFAGVLPAGFALKALGGWLSRRPGDVALAARRLMIALVGVVCVQAATTAVSAVVMEVLDVEPRSILGRAFVYRLAEASLAQKVGAAFMTPQEHAELIERLKSSADDQVLRDTIDIVAKADYTWVPTFNRITKDIESCEDCCRHPRCLYAAVDRRLNRVARHALLSFDPVLLRDAALRTGEVLFPFFVAPPFHPESAAWFDWRRLNDDWDMRGPTYERFAAPALTERFRWHLGSDFSFVVNAAMQLRGIMVIAALAVLAVLLPFARQAAPLALGLMSAILAYAAMNAIVTVYVPRYGLFIDIVALFAIVVASVGFYEARRQGRVTHKGQDA